MNEWHLAVDIGASSGKALAGRVENGKIITKEIYRFQNSQIEKNGHLCWQIESLIKNVIISLKACTQRGIIPASVAIDTWGVDFVLLDKDGKMLGDAVCYRDSRTKGIQDELAAEHIITFEELYERTGIQYQPFNTIYQLVALKREHPEQIQNAETFLMIPEYLNYILTGVSMNEYTNATTTALVNAESKTWDHEILERISIPRKLFGKLQMPGTKVGRLTSEIQKIVGFDCDVILPATHDTGSAFAAVPAGEHSIFLSSGTWSLLGVENEKPSTNEKSRMANFTNEGGVEYRYRYLKNIMGLWMIQSVRKEENQEREEEVSFPELIEEAKQATRYPGRVNVDDDRFLSPISMKNEVSKACIKEGYEAPHSTGEVLQCIYQSLAEDYAATIKKLEELTGNTYDAINIVGGGCQDMYLNQLTANATGLPVYAGPIEGTALGNLIVQFIQAGDYKDIADARKAIRESFDIKEVRLL